jgi:hypothetical protein
MAKMNIVFNLFTLIIPLLFSETHRWKKFTCSFQDHLLNNYTKSGGKMEKIDVISFRTSGIVPSFGVFAIQCHNSACHFRFIFFLKFMIE